MPLAGCVLVQTLLSSALLSAPLAPRALRSPSRPAVLMQEVDAPAAPAARVRASERARSGRQPAEQVLRLSASPPRRPCACLLRVAPGVARGHLVCA